ncbi:hypothetical protein ACOI1H_24105 [Loktanella sp. DJP18]|uniref:hypothetical protein n=1 Tax=Loktanella sp. DJP18 TaxID=3409788 RepID=UPI003BB4BDCA
MTASPETISVASSPTSGAARRHSVGALITGLALILWATALPAYPRDPHQTLQTVLAEDIMIVAVSDNPPWVKLRDEAPPAGAEAALVLAFAEALGVHVDWLRLSGFEAIHAVEQGKADLAFFAVTLLRTGSPRRPMTISPGRFWLQCRQAATRP